MSFDVSHYRPPSHWSDKIKGTECNGCRCLEVILRRHRWHSYEEYFCSIRHEIVDPFAVKCNCRIPDDAKSREGN